MTPEKGEATVEKALSIASCSALSCPGFDGAVVAVLPEPPAALTSACCWLDPFPASSTANVMNDASAIKQITIEANLNSLASNPKSTAAD